MRWVIRTSEVAVLGTTTITLCSINIAHRSVGSGLRGSSFFPRSDDSGFGSVECRPLGAYSAGEGHRQHLIRAQEGGHIAVSRGGLGAGYHRAKNWR
jgi:hypothetical protein